MHKETPELNNHYKSNSVIPEKLTITQTAEPLLNDDEVSQTPDHPSSNEDLKNDLDASPPKTLELKLDPIVIKVEQTGSLE